MQTVAHAGLGAITAKLRGQDVVAGAIGGATESVLGNLASFDSTDNGNKALYVGAATLAGGLVAKALGRDAVTAGQAAQNAALNNRLATQQEKDKIRALANGDPEMEKRLVAASCYKTNCSAEYPEGSGVWKQMRALEIAGSQDSQALGLLANQTAPVTVLGMTVGTKQLFQYSTGDAVLDKASLLNNTYQVGTRTTGAVQAAGGVMTGAVGVGMVVTGGATCLETGVGCLAAAGGTALTGWSADQTKAGWNAMTSGEPQQTLGGAALSQLFGISPQAGELLYGVAGLAPAAVEAVALNRAADAYGASQTAARATYGASQTAPTGTVFDAIKATQPVYPGSVIPRSFELTLPNGQGVWVAGNATEHIAEFSQMKAVTSTPEAVRLASQQQLSSLQGAVNTATQNGIPYNQLINVGGWELKFAPPRQPGQLPALIHALPGQ
jgi:filamentous hemagglutinin